MTMPTKTQFILYAINHLLKGEYHKALWLIQCLINSEEAATREYC